MMNWRRWGLGFGIVTVVIAGGSLLWLRGQSGAKVAIGEEALLSPLPQTPEIQVFFNHSQASEYTDPYRQVLRRGDDLEAVILSEIAAATTSIEVAVQEINLPKVAQALVDKHRAGVAVRVVMENDYTTPLSSLSPQAIAELDERSRNKYDEFLALADLDGNGQVSPSEAAAQEVITILEEGNVPWLDDTADGSKGSDLMHHKFVVVDGRKVITGSANFTLSGVHGDLSAPETRGNANHLLVLDSPELAEILRSEFELMWGDGPGGSLDSQFGLQKPQRTFTPLTIGNSSVRVHFSPSSKSAPWNVSTNAQIQAVLSQATTSVDLALLVFSEQKIVDALGDAQLTGAQVRALIDPGFAYRYYSEGLDLLGVALPNRKCKYEDDNQPWTAPLSTVGVPNLPKGDKLHHKFGIVDNYRVVTGSHNWSAAANHGNDETLLIIDNPQVAAHFTREFERLYADATLGVPLWLQDKVTEGKSRCNL